MAKTTLKSPKATITKHTIKYHSFGINFYPPCYILDKNTKKTGIVPHQPLSYHSHHAIFPPLSQKQYNCNYEATSYHMVSLGLWCTACFSSASSLRLNYVLIFSIFYITSSYISDWTTCASS